MFVFTPMILDRRFRPVGGISRWLRNGWKVSAKASFNSCMCSVTTFADHWQA